MSAKTPKSFNDSQHRSLMKSLKYHHMQPFWTCLLLILAIFAGFSFVYSSTPVACICIGFIGVTCLLLWKRQKVNQYWEGLLIIFAVVSYDGLLYALISIVKLVSTQDAFFIGYSFALLHIILQSRIIRICNLLKIDMVLFVGRLLTP